VATRAGLMPPKAARTAGPPEGAAAPMNQSREAHHPAGEGRDGWATDEQRTTLLILVRGRFRLDLSMASTTLEREGDYAVWVQGLTIPGRPRRTPL
jgi:hypothetical protein